MEGVLRCVKFSRISDPRKAFWPAFSVSGISDDWYRTTMGVIILSLETPQTAGENFRCTWKHLSAPATSLGVPMTSLEVPAMNLGAPPITVQQSGKNNIFFGNAASCWKQKRKDEEAQLSINPKRWNTMNIYMNEGKGKPNADYQSWSPMPITSAERTSFPWRQARPISASEAGGGRRDWWGQTRLVGAGEAGGGRWGQWRL